MPDHSVRIIWLPVEPGAGGEFMRLRHRLSGNDHDANARPAVMHLSGERQAVDPSRHIYVGEDQLHIGIPLQEFDRLVTVRGLDYPKTSVSEDADSRKAYQRFVFDDQDQGRNVQ